MPADGRSVRSTGKKKEGNPIKPEAEKKEKLNDDNNTMSEPRYQTYKSSTCEREVTQCNTHKKSSMETNGSERMGDDTVNLMK